MCGISGVAMYPKERTTQELNYIRSLVGNLATEIQSRGTDATGFAIFNKKGEHEIFKSNIDASTMVEMDTYEDFTKRTINNETTNILIHTRMATKGSKENNDNNHPIESVNTIGIHNGMLWNDDELFREKNMFRQAQVDSEVIFRLFDLEREMKVKNIKNVAETISGVFAVAFVEKSNPFVLNYFRDSNPTTFAFIPSLNIIIFASESRHVAEAIKYTNLEFEYLPQSESFLVNEDEVETRMPERNSIMQFDVSENAQGAYLDFNQTENRFVENYDDGFGFGGGGWYNYLREEEKPKANNIYDIILENKLLFSDDDFVTIIELIEKAESDSFASGYKAGRESLDNDIRIKEEVAYGKGYLDGAMTETKA